MYPTIIIAKYKMIMENYCHDNPILREYAYNECAYIDRRLRFINKENQLRGLNPKGQKILLIYGWRDAGREDDDLWGLSFHIQNFINRGSIIIGDYNYINEDEWNVFKDLEFRYKNKKKIKRKKKIKYIDSRPITRFELMDI